jgi:hypothetical protein
VHVNACSHKACAVACTCSQYRLRLLQTWPELAKPGSNSLQPTRLDHTEEKASEPIRRGSLKYPSQRSKVRSHWLVGVGAFWSLAPARQNKRFRHDCLSNKESARRRRTSGADETVGRFHERAAKRKGLKNEFIQDPIIKCKMADARKNLHGCVSWGAGSSHLASEIQCERRDGGMRLRLELAAFVCSSSGMRVFGSSQWSRLKYSRPRFWRQIYSRARFWRRVNLTSILASNLQ